MTVAFVSARMALYPASPPVLCMKYYCTHSTGIIKDSCRTQRLVVKIVLGGSGTRKIIRFGKISISTFSYSPQVYTRMFGLWFQAKFASL